MQHWRLDKQQKLSLNAFLGDLVRIPSHSCNEGQVAQRIILEMERLGYDDVVVDAAGNVIGRIGPTEGPGLMFNSHMDTVEAADLTSWRVDPFSATVDGDILYGLGSADMKGGLAATVYGASQLIEWKEKLKGPIYVACVVLEEPSEGTGTRVLFEEDGLTPKWVVIAEPSNLQIVRAQRGHMEMMLSIKGKSAHSSAPELGVNAIYAASRVVFGLEMLAGQLLHDPFLGEGVLAVTDITSHAVSRNAVPDLCELFIDRRLTVGETEAMALSEIERVVSIEGVEGQVKVIEEEITSYTGKTFSVRRMSMPWAFDERHPLVQAMTKATRKAGVKPVITRWQFATEGAYSAGVAQVPTVGFGPGDPLKAHTCNENIPLSQVHSATAVYAALADRLLT